MTSVSRRCVYALVAALVAALGAACAGGGPGRRTFEFRGPTMGTTYSVKVVTGPAGLVGSARSEIGEAIEVELERINALMSTWDAESELSRFNRSTGQEPFPVSQETFEVFRWAVDLGALTGGGLDVTVAPLLDAWGFGPGGRRDRLPDADEITRLLEAAGTRHLELDAVARTVRKTRPDVRCDFSALAAGYTADRLWSRLAEQGQTDFLIDMGGELRARGRKDARDPWQIAIERPQPGGRFIERMVPILDLAIATSGDYRNYYEEDGERIAHILDPRTGRPIQHRLASVTVIDALAVRADALSTALMVLGPEHGFALAEQLELAALFIVRSEAGGFTVRATPRFDALTVSSTPPEPSTMGLILLSVIVVALAMLIMAVGAIFSNRCLRGSCGGRDVLGPDGEPLMCDTCPQRDKPRITVNVHPTPSRTSLERRVITVRSA